MSADYAFEQSDHATVKVDLSLEADIQPGPGLNRINPEVLNNPVSLLAVIAEMSEMLGQIPAGWNPHERLEYIKMAIRNTVSEAVGRERSELGQDIEELEESVNEMHGLKVVCIKPLGCCW